MAEKKTGAFKTPKAREVTVAAGLREAEFDFGPQAPSQPARLGQLNEVVRGHMEWMFQHYPRIGAKILDPKANPHFYPVMHRDFARFKVAMHRARVYASREEIADAFRSNVESAAASARAAPERKSEFFYGLFTPLNQIIHTDPGLKYLYPRRAETDNMILARTAPITPESLAMIATHATTRALKARESAVSLDYGPENPERELKLAMMAGASAALVPFEMRGVLIDSKTLVQVITAIGTRANRNPASLSPRLAKALSAPSVSRRDARHLLDSMSERQAHHNISLAAQTASNLPLPEATEKITEQLSGLGLPPKVVPAFAKHVAQLGRVSDHDQATTIARNTAKFVEKSVDHWIKSGTDPHDFGLKIRRLLEIVAVQNWHPATEGVFKDLHVAVSERLTAALPPVKTKQRSGAAASVFLEDVEGTLDNDAFYAAHPDVAMLADYESALSGARSALFEKGVQRKPT